MSEDDSPSVTETIGHAQPQLGEVLAAQRASKNMTVNEVASQLRLSIRQINALETNNFIQLPEPMITRGFIRNYARLLGIEAEPLIQAHRALSGAEQPHSLNISSENISIASNGRTPWIKVSFLGMLALLIILGLSYYANHPYSNAVQPTDSPTKKQNVLESTSSEPASNSANRVEEKLPEPALPIAERLAEGNVPTGSSELTVSEATTSQKPEGEIANVKTVPEPQSTDTLPVGTQLEFDLNFSEQSWVSVVDGDNKEIYSKLSAAGTSEKVVGKPPLKLHIGNASGTQITYKNKSVDLGQYTKNNIARLTLSLEQN